MRSLRPLAIATALAGALAAQPAAAQTAQPVPVAPPPDLRPIIVGLGAIAGVVVFNVAALGIEALPGGLAYARAAGAGGAVVPAEMSVAMSRVYATTSAVLGGWVGYYYGPWR